MNTSILRAPANPVLPTVLVLDDDDFFHLVMGEYFSLLGVGQVLQAKNGSDALKLLKTHAQPIDYLVCDVFMPDMDGIEFLTHLIDLKYAGGVVVASGVDIEMLDLARTLATDSGLRLLGAFTKPIALSQLAAALGMPMPDTRAA
jgi:CheY-like chemotaxis protein